VLADPVEINWQEMTGRDHKNNGVIPTPHPFVGGGELTVRAQLYSAPSARHESFTGYQAQTDPTDGLTQICGPGMTSCVAYRSSAMSGGSHTLRIEGQLAHVMAVKRNTRGATWAVPLACQSAQAEAPPPDEIRRQAPFKCDPDLKDALREYLERPTGVLSLATEIREIATEPGVIRDNLFRLLAFKETQLRHFNDLTLDGATAGNAGVPAEAAWPILNTVGNRACPSCNPPTPDTRQTDGGVGIMQVTGGRPPYEQVWNYKRNIEEGVRRFGDSVSQANARLDALRAEIQTLREHVAATHGIELEWPVTAEHIRHEAYRMYNKGHNKPLLHAVARNLTGPGIFLKMTRNDEYVSAMKRYEQLLQVNGTLDHTW